MLPARILVVDDNKHVISALKMFINDEFEHVDFITNPNQLISKIHLNNYDVVLLDMNFTAGINTGNEGIYWLNEIKKVKTDIEIVMLTAYGGVELAVKALKQGACDFVLKPWDNEKLLATLRSAYKLRKSNLQISELEKKESSYKKEISKEQQLLLGSSAPMLKIKKLIAKIAKTDANVLITGENGTGKEVLAREIHFQSLRKNEIFVTVDLGALPETLFESEIFGHKKGAFTDAIEDKTGKFQLAHNGTLFLDEIGNIPVHLQSKLLVALQERKITPVGSTKTCSVNIRLISATNQDLQELLKTGMFREDLLYRINTIHMEVPPLRERIEDVEVLAQHFLQKYAEKYRKQNLRLGKQALKKLQEYIWPGNIRELEHTIEKAVILSESSIITPDDFLFKPSRKVRGEKDVTIDEMERELIFNALEKHEGNFSAAAKQLGITRQTLYNKMKKHDI